ncbi:MAG: pilus assembly protein [Ardenticatenaceae bacterium]|nr:pilus assembly protein [Ardenticatenaceae bacterium]
MKHMIKKVRNLKQGQSLVEVALFIPVALIIIAGVVEIGQWLVTQNRVVTAARASTRFGANGGNDENMAIVALNTVTETLPLEADRWDIYSIRGEVNEQGTGFVGAANDITFEHIYGNSNTTFAQELAANTIDVQARLRTDILESLQRQEDGTLVTESAQGIQFVGTYAVFEAESIIGMDYFVEDVYSVRDLAVMRTYPSTDASNGCSAFPIAVEWQRSVDDDLSGANTFPLPADFSYPTSNEPTLLDFPNHIPDVPFDQAPPGTIYRIWDGGGPGNFGWLYWNTDVNGASDVAGSLAWPGNSIDYVNGPNGNPGPNSAATSAGFSHKVWGYIEPNSDEFPADTSMQTGDWVSGRTGAINSSAVNDALEDHIDNERILRLPIWEVSSGSGNNVEYTILSFGLFRLHGFNLTGGQQWILAEFIGLDDSCGQSTANNLP